MTDRGGWHAAVHGVTKSPDLGHDLATEQQKTGGPNPLNSKTQLVFHFGLDLYVNKNVNSERVLIQYVRRY